MIDATEFERLFKTYYSPMYRVAYSMLGDTEQSKDIVSDVFASLWQGNVVVRTDTERSFLMQCVVNACKNHIARLSRDERLCHRYSLDGMGEPSNDIEERWRQVNSYINDQLSEQTARILRLCLVSGYSYNEAAQELQVSRSTINKHIVNGLKQLREKFRTK